MRKLPLKPMSRRFGRAVGEASRDFRDDDFLAVGAAAQLAGCSVRTIRRAYRAGRLRAYRDGNGHGVRVRYEDLRRWMMATSAGPATASGTAQPSTAIQHFDMHGKTAAPTGEYLALLNGARAQRQR